MSHLALEDIKDISPEKAYNLFFQNKAIMIDVRTQAERFFTGYVPGSLHIEWSYYPSGLLNPHFISELKEQCPQSDTVFLFLCRSGVRSLYAAAAAASHGYTHTYNISEGFEGDINPISMQRNLNGWKVKNLPWIH